MNVAQLVLFAWVATWVLTESFVPDTSYHDKLQGAAIAAFAVGYSNDAHRLLWRKMRNTFKKK